MYAKSFLAFDGNGRLTGARTAQTAPYDRYTCHLCGSALRYHPQYDTERPWFEHTGEGLAEHGHECPYARPERREILLIKRLQQWVPDALPVVRKTSWHCNNVTTIIMGSSTAHTVIQGVSVRRQWQDERSKNGAGDHAR